MVDALARVWMHWRVLACDKLEGHLVPACDKLLVCTCNFICCIYEVYFAVQTLCTCRSDFQLMFSW
jgi:hypothetical protein